MKKRIRHKSPVPSLEQTSRDELTDTRANGAQTLSADDLPARLLLQLKKIFYPLRDTPPAHQKEACCMNRSVARSFGRSLGRSLGRLVDRSLDRSVDRPSGRLIQ